MSIISKRNGHIDWFILLPVAGLMFFSLAFVYSASATIAEMRFGMAEKLFWNHALRVFIGLLIMIGFAKIDYHFWQKISKPLIIFSILLLVFVLAGGSTIKGASRWINLGPISFQPSELAKFALVIHFAALFAIKRDVIKDLEKGFLPLILWTILICGLIALQPNFSNMMVIFIISLLMMFIGNTNLIHLGAASLAGLTAAGIYAVSAPYRMNRFLAFFGSDNGAVDIENVSYQLNQSLIALGNGGLLGVGPGQNRQSHLFLPESYGDFIFAIIGEEYGFIGVFFILAVFVFILWRGLLIAKRAPDDFGYFLAAGIIITFAVYVFVNAGVNTGLLPTTGVPMPFISYGGTAVFIYAAAIGILLNISSHTDLYTPFEGTAKSEWEPATETE
ncbi:MAG: putative lipid II flippase FtsW [Candidatus Kapaibacterium sp.]